MSSFLFGLRKKFLPFYAIVLDMIGALRLGSIRLPGAQTAAGMGSQADTAPIL
jgi:hypothetical protein